MDGNLARQYFLEPHQTFQRQYEALRAIFVDEQPIDRVAERFGYKPAALKSMASRLRTDCRQGVAPPFFSTMAADDPQVRARANSNRVPKRQTSRIVAN